MNKLISYHNYKGGVNNLQVVKVLGKGLGNKEEARQYATDWQKKFADNEMGTDWKELCDWQKKFETLAEKFDLTEEFKENGII